MNILFYTHPFIALSIFLDVIILWSCQKLALQNKLNLMKLASTLSAHSVLNYHPWCSWKLRQLETTKQPPHISHNFKTKPIFFGWNFHLVSHPPTSTRSPICCAPAPRHSLARRPAENRKPKSQSPRGPRQLYLATAHLETPKMVQEISNIWPFQFLDLKIY